MSLWTRKLLFLFIMLPFNIAWADGIETLKIFNKNLTSLSGSFSQTVTNAKKTQKTSGTFQVLRPGYFKWIYTKPFKQDIIGDGNHVWLYDKDLAQVVKRQQKGSLGDSPAALLADQNALETRFNLKNDGVTDGIEYVTALPKSQESGYQYIQAGFKNGELNFMKLKDSYGNYTEILFSNLSKKDLNKKSFSFSPPKGIDVLTE